MLGAVSCLNCHHISRINAERHQSGRGPRAQLAGTRPRSGTSNRLLASSDRGLFMQGSVPAKHVDERRR
jgi:hypothetical protein